MKILFVTGTDTGVGKTEVACALVAAWRRLGRRVTALKPVETGCPRRAGRLVARDGARLARAAGLDAELVCPLRFASAAAPAVAARAARKRVDLEVIDRAVAAVSRDADALVVEGAGGLLVPLADGLTNAELARHLGATLLIVGRAGLGTLNHTLLTLEAARARDLAVAGIILNRTRPGRSFAERSNPEMLGRLANAALFGTLPFARRRRSLDALAQVAYERLDLERLWLGL